MNTATAIVVGTAMILGATALSTRPPRDNFERCIHITKIIVDDHPWMSAMDIFDKCMDRLSEKNINN